MVLKDYLKGLLKGHKRKKGIRVEGLWIRRFQKHGKNESGKRLYGKE